MYKFLASVLPKIFSTLSFISAAALFVNVSAKILKLSTPFAIKCAIRVVNTFVFPLPAPATIINGPLRWLTASFCGWFNSSK